jgi:hypothetical protein
LVALEADVIQIGRSNRSRLGREPVSCPMRAVGVMTLVSGEHPAKMTFVVDQEPVGAFPPDGADLPFGDRIQPAAREPGSGSPEHRAR